MRFGEDILILVVGGFSLMAHPNQVRLLMFANSKYVFLCVVPPVQATSAPTEIEVDWSSCATKGIGRSTAASVLVAADPEWTPEGALSAAAVSGVRQLAEAGARNIRLLNFNIFPIMSCAQG